MRRYMMRIAEHFAKKNGCLGLVTGESIGQVASQTMQSLAATNAVCTLPVYRPLIGFDKKEIVEISEKIDTYEVSSAVFIRSSIQSARLISDFSILSTFGFVTGCFATKIVQQSSNGWIETAEVITVGA